MNDSIIDYINQSSQRHVFLFRYHDLACSDMLMTDLTTDMVCSIHNRLIVRDIPIDDEQTRRRNIANSNNEKLAVRYYVVDNCICIVVATLRKQGHYDHA